MQVTELNDKTDLQVYKLVSLNRHLKYKQCDQIGRFIELWATFQCPRPQLI